MKIQYVWIDVLEPNFQTETVDGVDVQTVDGNCWHCEEAEPTTAAVISLGGMLSLTIGVCDSCNEKLQTNE